MLLFKFSGKDKFNNPISGTVESKSFDEAKKTLEAKGYRFILLALIDSVQPTDKTFYFEAINRFNNKIFGEIEATDLGAAYQELTRDLYTEIVISEKPFTTTKLISSNNNFVSNDINFHDSSYTKQINSNFYNSEPNVKSEVFNPYPQYMTNRNDFSLELIENQKEFPNNIKIHPKNNVSKRSACFWLTLGYITKAVAFNVLFIKLAVELNRARSNYDQRYTYTALPIIGIIMDIFLFGVSKSQIPIEIYPSWFWIMMVIYVGLNIYWFQTFCDRIHDELDRRNIAFNYSSLNYWLMAFIPMCLHCVVAYWVENISSLIIFIIINLLVLIVKYIFYYLTIKAMNLINEDYNNGMNNI